MRFGLPLATLISAHLNIYIKRFSHFFEFHPRLPPGTKKGGERGGGCAPILIYKLKFIQYSYLLLQIAVTR